MKSYLFAYLLLCSNLLLSKSILLNEAIANNQISIEVSGEGGHSGKSLKIKFLNQTKKDLEIKVPAGQIFHSQDSTMQDLMITKGKVLALEKQQNRISKFYGMCIQANNSSPSVGSVFNLGALATGSLLKVAEFIFHNRLYENASAQSAIWVVTDGHRLEYIEDPKLAAFMAKTLGKERPEYTITHENNSAPGQPAFQYAPAKIEGVFNYSLAEDQKVSFGLFNEEGELVRSFFKNKAQERGIWKFDFYFEISRLPKGKYSVRLTKGDIEIERREVEF
ncbi:hypothetical protein OAF63_00390 [Saprospiraceae bacterium]|jgi:hypothetical protein|nr:hypothetical protein [Bacteroidota bacterium]MDB4727219.1 hypothetical protein [Saprospiraceae bacterium]MDF1865041.1 hypothetical protein [Saprospiraceae bacterium]